MCVYIYIYIYINKPSFTDLGKSKGGMVYLRCPAIGFLIHYQHTNTINTTHNINILFTLLTLLTY